MPRVTSKAAAETLRSSSRLAKILENIRRQPKPVLHNVQSLRLIYAAQNNHFGARKFVRNELVRLAYHNPNLKATVEPIKRLKDAWLYLRFNNKSEIQVPMHNRLPHEILRSVLDIAGTRRRMPTPAEAAVETNRIAQQLRAHGTLAAEKRRAEAYVRRRMLRRELARLPGKDRRVPATVRRIIKKIAKVRRASERAAKAADGRVVTPKTRAEKKAAAAALREAKSEAAAKAAAAAAAKAAASKPAAKAGARAKPNAKPAKAGGTPAKAGGTPAKAGPAAKAGTPGKASSAAKAGPVATTAPAAKGPSPANPAAKAAAAATSPKVAAAATPVKPPVKAATPAPKPKQKAAPIPPLAPAKGGPAAGARA